MEIRGGSKKALRRSNTLLAFGAIVVVIFSTNLGGGLNKIGTTDPLSNSLFFPIVVVSLRTIWGGHWRSKNTTAWQFTTFPSRRGRKLVRTLGFLWESLKIQNQE